VQLQKLQFLKIEKVDFSIFRIVQLCKLRKLCYENCKSASRENCKSANRKSCNFPIFRIAKNCDFETAVVSYGITSYENYESITSVPEVITWNCKIANLKIATLLFLG
jgi:hypothetical protein